LKQDLKKGQPESQHPNQKSFRSEA